MSNFQKAPLQKDGIATMKTRHFKRLLCTALSATALCTPVLADDWVAVKLRGDVFQYQDGAWVPLNKGDVVSDRRDIRTGSNGRVQFQRDQETIDMAPGTHIKIYDRRGMDRFTIVQEGTGTVTIDAERQNVKHFAVVTPYLAAVVKGTRFTVNADNANASVGVERGQVEVRDLERKVVVEVTPGQSASAGQTAELKVTGKGASEVVVPYQGGGLAPVITPVLPPNASPKAVEALQRVAEMQKKGPHEGENENSGRQNSNAGGNGNKTGQSNASSNSNSGGNSSSNSNAGGNGHDESKSHGSGNQNGHDNDKGHDNGRNDEHSNGKGKNK